MSSEPGSGASFLHRLPGGIETILSIFCLRMMPVQGVSHLNWVSRCSLADVAFIHDRARMGDVAPVLGWFGPDLSRVGAADWRLRAYQSALCGQSYCLGIPDHGGNFAVVFLKQILAGRGWLGVCTTAGCYVRVLRWIHAGMARHCRHRARLA